MNAAERQCESCKFRWTTIEENPFCVKGLAPDMENYPCQWFDPKATKATKVASQDVKEGEST